MWRYLTNSVMLTGQIGITFHFKLALHAKVAHVLNYWSLISQSLIFNVTFYAAGSRFPSHLTAEMMVAVRIEVATQLAHKLTKTLRPSQHGKYCDLPKKSQKCGSSKWELNKLSLVWSSKAKKEKEAEKSLAAQLKKLEKEAKGEPAP